MPPVKSSQMQAFTLRAEALEKLGCDCKRHIGKTHLNRHRPSGLVKNNFLHSNGVPGSREPSQEPEGRPGGIGALIRSLKAL